MKRLSSVLVAAALAGGVGVLTAGPAAAAHCGTGPGYSGFGQHAQASTDPEGGEGNLHQGTPGASNCRATTGSPSDRAPGRQ